MIVGKESCMYEGVDLNEINTDCLLIIIDDMIRDSDKVDDLLAQLMRVTISRIVCVDKMYGKAYSNLLGWIDTFKCNCDTQEFNEKYLMLILDLALIILTAAIEEKDKINTYGKNKIVAIINIMGVRLSMCKLEETNIFNDNVIKKANELLHVAKQFKSKIASNTLKNTYEVGVSRIDFIITSYNDMKNEATLLVSDYNNKSDKKLSKKSIKSISRVNKRDLEQILKQIEEYDIASQEKILRRVMLLTPSSFFDIVLNRRNVFETIIAIGMDGVNISELINHHIVVYVNELCRNVLVNSENVYGNIWTAYDEVSDWIDALLKKISESDDILLYSTKLTLLKHFEKFVESEMFKDYKDNIINNKHRVIRDKICKYKGDITANLLKNDITKFNMMKNTKISEIVKRRITLRNEIILLSENSHVVLREVLMDATDVQQSGGIIYSKEDNSWVYFKATKQVSLISSYVKIMDLISELSDTTLYNDFIELVNYVEMDMCILSKWCEDGATPYDKVYCALSKNLSEKEVMNVICYLRSIETRSIIGTKEGKLNALLEDFFIKNIDKILSVMDTRKPKDLIYIFCDILKDYIQCYSICLSLSNLTSRKREVVIKILEKLFNENEPKLKAMHDLYSIRLFGEKLDYMKNDKVIDKILMCYIEEPFVSINLSC